MPLRRAQHWRHGRLIIAVTAAITVGTSVSAAIISSGHDTPDQKPPVVEVTTPTKAAGLAGVSDDTTVTVRCVDNVACTRVQFTINGGNLEAEDTNGGDGWTITWNTTDVADGTYSIGAIAADAVGLTAVAYPVNVTVANGITGGGTQTAKLWVAPSGSAACTRSSSAVDYTAAVAAGNVCDKLSTAHKKFTTCGDVAVVKGGSYGADEIDKHLTLSCTSTHVEFDGATGETIQYTAPLSLGGPCGSCNNVEPPGGITFDGTGSTWKFDTSAGSNWTGGIVGNYNNAHNTRPHDLTFKYLTIFNGDRLDSGDGMLLNNPQHIVLDHITINGACCGSLGHNTGFASCDINVNGSCTANSPVGLRVGLRAAGANPNPDDITIKDSTIRYIMRDCANWPTALYGACPSGDVRDGTLVAAGTRCAVYRTSTGGTDSCHVDGTQWYGGQNFTIQRFKCYGSDVQCLFFGNANGGTFGGTNLIADSVLQPVGGSCGICVSVGGAANSISGDWTIRNNITNADIRFSAMTSIQSGTTIRLLGNIGSIANNNGGSGSCTGGTGVTWVYAYNVEDLFGGASAGPCDATDVTWTSDGSGDLPSTLVADGSQAPSATTDFHLVTGAVAGTNALTNLIPAATSWCSGTDIDGDPRPTGSGCEPGPDELSAGGTLVTGASTAACTGSCTAIGYNPTASAGCVSNTTNHIRSVGNVNDGVQTACRIYGYAYSPTLKIDGSATGKPAALMIAGGAGCGGSETATVWDDHDAAAQAVAGKFVVLILSKPTNPGCRSAWYHPNIDVPAPTAPFGSDEPYIAAVIADAEAQFNIDPQRIYISGSSSGGALAWDMACDATMSTQIRGIAPISNLVQIQKSGSSPVINTERCNSTNKNLFVMYQNGTADTQTFLNGTCLTTHCLASFDETRRWWAAHMGCGATATQTSYGTPTAANTKYLYTACGFGSPAATVNFNLISGGIHGASGITTTTYKEGSAGASCAPSTCNDSFAVRDMWAFFSAAAWVQ